jgi:hypothetical protein
MPVTKRQIGIATFALAVLTVALYVTSASTATAPQGTAPGMTALPIDIVGLMRKAKGLPEQQYDAF